MKIAEYTYSPKFRKETDFMDFTGDVQNILNLGRYQMRVVTTAPTHTGEGGEHLLFISGTVRRLYIWDDTNSTWHYIEWNGTGENTPSVVANVALTDQNASIGATTIYTPSAAGIYRASVHHLCTTAGAAGTLDTTILWTNDIGATSSIPAGQISLDGAGNWGSGIVVIRSTATAIQYSTTKVDGAGSQYALYIALERLF